MWVKLGVFVIIKVDQKKWCFVYISCMSTASLLKLNNNNKYKEKRRLLSEITLSYNLFCNVLSNSNTAKLTRTFKPKDIWQ